ncbi:NfeD family protein [Nocardioides aequoreus]|uniref:NfeD family protein n=1 Tax=Nocardioides aequoreus TaxID=397278 RepID=UPI00068A7E81|nr:NfeD family protein [Nocardioides aequoreus]
MTALLVVGVVGLVVLAVSLLLGDVLDGLLDALAGDTFSTAVLGGFVSAFGFGGAAADAAGAPWPLTLGVGVVAGVAVGWFAAWLTRLVRDGGSDATPEADDLLGREGQVVSAIPADGYGTVRVLLGGHVVRVNARADGPLEAGTAVHVTSILSPTAVTVSPHDPLAAPGWGELT